MIVENLNNMIKTENCIILPAIHKETKEFAVYKEIDFGRELTKEEIQKRGDGVATTLKKCENLVEVYEAKLINKRKLFLIMEWCEMNLRDIILFK